MDKKTIAILVAAAVVGYVLYTQSQSTTNLALQPKTGTNGNCVPVSAASLVQIAATPDFQPWRVPYADEWSSMYGTFEQGMGYPMADPQRPIPAGKPGPFQILSWFKGMDINPVHHQNFAIKYKNDILNYYNTCVQVNDFMQVITGGFLK